MEYVLLRRDEPDRAGIWVFVELKTDVRSIGSEQAFTYARRILGRSMADSVSDVRARRDVSSQQAKHDELLGRFDGLPLERSIEVMYLSPSRHNAQDVLTADADLRVAPVFDRVLHSVAFSELEAIELSDYAGEWDVFQELCSA